VFNLDVEVFLTGSSVTPEDVRGRTVVVVDVLRTSATIVTALANGARDVIPVPDIGEASRMAASLDPEGYVLGGEKLGKRIDGYQLGNSPGEFTREAVSGRTVILHTSNGTSTVLACAEAETLMIGSFINVSAVVAEVIKANQDLTIVCAGWINRVSLEDTLFAGMVLDLLWEGGNPPMSDTAYMALSQYRHDSADLSVPIGRCNHARRLESLGFAGDVQACIEQDTTSAVPFYQDRRLVLKTSGSESKSSGVPPEDLSSA